MEIINQNQQNSNQTHPQLEYSKIYPNIAFVHNDKKQLLSCNINIQACYKPLQLNNNKINFYYGAVMKLFAQLSSINQSNQRNIKIHDIWVCQKEITIYPILVYFSNGKKYPVANCCFRCIFIQFQSQLCGSVKCVQCHKIVFSFVHINKNSYQIVDSIKKKYEKSAKTELSTHKQNSGIFDGCKKSRQLGNKHINNAQLFKQYKMINESRKQNIRKLISSNQHRHKSFKKIMGLGNNFYDTKHGKIAHNNPNKCSQHNTAQNNKQNRIMRSVVMSRINNTDENDQKCYTAQYNDQQIRKSNRTDQNRVSIKGICPIDDIGQFIIQIEHSLRINKENLHHVHKFQNAKIETNLAKYNEEQIEALKQTKMIILQIFS